MSIYLSVVEAFTVSLFPTTMAVPSKQVVFLFTMPQTSFDSKESQQSLSKINEAGFPQSEFTNFFNHV